MSLPKVGILTEVRACGIRELLPRSIVNPTAKNGITRLAMRLKFSYIAAALKSRAPGQSSSVAKIGLLPTGR